MSIDAPSPERAGNALLWAGILAISAMWGSSFLLAKLAVATVSPASLAAFRGGLSAIVLLAVFAAAGRSLLPRTGEIGFALVLGTLSGWLPNLLTNLALGSIDSARAGMLNGTTPLFVMLLAHLALRDERITATTLLGMGTGFAGLLLLVGPGGGGSLIGHLLMVAVALCYAAGTVFARHRRPADPARLAFLQQSCSGLGALALALGIDGGISMPPPGATWLVLLLLGALGTAAPMVVYLWLLGRTTATRVATVGYLQPIWAAALGAIILGERLTPAALAGCALVLGGVWLTSRTVRRSPDRSG